MKLLKILVVLVALALVWLLYVRWALGNDAASNGAITSFEECAAAGNPIAESFPRQCRTPEGYLFAEGVD